MIKAELEFQFLASPHVLERLLALPGELRPTHQALGENEIGVAICGPYELAQSLENDGSGFFLKNANVLYDIRKSKGGTLICNAYFEKSPSSIIIDYLVQMAMMDLIFGFSCAPEEREAKNRVTTKIGLNTIESWVGRDTKKYIPGLYWVTLLSTALAQKHGISLSALEHVALQHVELEGDQHLFRFYEKPKDWRSATRVAELCSALSGVFDIEKVRSKLETATTFLELNALINNWK